MYELRATSYIASRSKSAFTYAATFVKRSLNTARPLASCHRGQLKLPAIYETRNGGRRSAWHRKSKWRDRRERKREIGHILQRVNPKARRYRRASLEYRHVFKTEHVPRGTSNTSAPNSSRRAINGKFRIGDSYGDSSLSLFFPDFPISRKALSYIADVVPSIDHPRSLGASEGSYNGMSSLKVWSAQLAVHTRLRASLFRAFAASLKDAHVQKKRKDEYNGDERVFLTLQLLYFLLTETGGSLSTNWCTYQLAFSTEITLRRTYNRDSRIEDTTVFSVRESIRYKITFYRFRKSSQKW